MKLVVGLGNPGQKYDGTRHNAGFRFVDELAKKLETAFTQADKFEAEIAETIYKGDKIILMKPQTYMNLSGKAVSMMMSYYNITAIDLIVISDDVDLPVGQARIRHDGSSGGQKGLQNIIDTLGSNDFTRVRIGIQSEMIATNQIDTADFVLSKFSKKEEVIVDEIIELTIGHVLPFIEKNEQVPAHTLSVES